MNETILDKEMYQANSLRMCWTALGMMIAHTVAAVNDPARMAKANRILMGQFLNLSGLVGSYIAFENKGCA